MQWNIKVPRAIEKGNIGGVNTSHPKERFNMICISTKPSKEPGTMSRNTTGPHVVIAILKLENMNPYDIFIIEKPKNIFGHQSNFGQMKAPPPSQYD